MAINVTLASGGVAGVTGLLAGQLGIVNNDQVIRRDGVYACGIDETGTPETTSFTLNLPTPGTDENFVGRVIIFKNFLPTTTPATTLTIGREDRGGTKANIDATNLDYVLDEQYQVVSFYYINDVIGWLAGPAVI